MSVLAAHVMADAIDLAFNEARMERLRVLRDRNVKRFDSYGLHPFSEAFGQISACQKIDRELEGVLVSPVLLRQAASEAAYREFVAEIRDEA